MALGDIVQIGNRVGSGGTANYSPTLTSTATTGNLLVCYVSVTVAGRTCTTPAGWTAGPTSSGGTAFSCHVFWKESDGTETGVTMTLSGSGGGYANIVEIDATGATLTALDATAEDTSNISTPTASQSSGVAVGTASAGIAVAFFGIDIGGNVSDGRAYTNSFVEQDTSDMNNTSRGGYTMASKVIAATSNSTVFSNTEGTEEMYGSIMVWSGTAPRSITNIDGDNSVQAGQTSVSIATVGLDSSPATQIATLDGKTLTIQSWSETEVVVDVPRYIDLLLGVTSYQLELTDDTGTVTLNDVELLPATGQAFVSLSNPVDTMGTLGEVYAGGATATGDQWVYDTNLTGDATITLTVDDRGYWILSGTPSITSTANFYRIDSTGTVDVADVIEFDVGGGGGGGSEKIVSDIVSGIISNIVKSI